MKEEKDMKQFAEYGRQGGLKGGPARMRSMSEEERADLGRAGARSRWKKAREAVVSKPKLHKVVAGMLDDIERTGERMVLYRDDGRFFYFQEGSSDERAAEGTYGGDAIIGSYGPGSRFSAIVGDAMQE